MKFGWSLSLAFAFLIGTAQCPAQNTSTDVPPVIDVHVHAMDDFGSFATPMCPNTPKFTASDPDTKEAPFGWVQEECTPKLYPSAKGQYMKDVLAEMDRLNVTAVVYGDPASVQKWKDAAPKRVIPGTPFTTRNGAGRPCSAGGTAKRLHRRWIQGHGRDRIAIRKPVAERSERRSVFRPRGKTGYSSGPSHGNRRVRTREHHDAELPRVQRGSTAA